jgi:hypothetical protein
MHKPIEKLFLHTQKLYTTLPNFCLSEPKCSSIFVYDEGDFWKG